MNWNLTKFHLSKWVKALHLHLIFRTWNASIKATIMYLVLIKSELCFHITFCEYYWNDCSILQLYERRVKMVNDGKESKRFRQLTLDCMSEELSPDESGSMRVHRPVWHSIVVSIHVYPFGACSRITDLWHSSTCFSKVDSGQRMA